MQYLKLNDLERDFLQEKHLAPLKKKEFGNEVSQCSLA
jgi:hypothetical protein